jgi:hypothetical protein
MKFKPWYTLCFILCSCQFVTVCPTHNTPVFTKGGQAETVLTAGGTGVNLNVAYSPVKHVSIMASGYSYPGLMYNGRYFHNSGEAEIGGYISRKHFYASIGGGYGAGCVNYVYQGRVTESVDISEPLIKRFNFDKPFLHLYIFYLNSDGASLGLSIKYDLYTMNYKYAKYFDLHGFDKGPFVFNQQLIEYCGVLNVPLNERIAMKINVGLGYQISENYTGPGTIIGKIGFTRTFGKK